MVVTPFSQGDFLQKKIPINKLPLLSLLPLFLPWCSEALKCLACTSKWSGNEGILLTLVYTQYQYRNINSISKVLVLDIGRCNNSRYLLKQMAFVAHLFTHYEKLKRRKSLSTNCPSLCSCPYSSPGAQRLFRVPPVPQNGQGMREYYSPW